MWKIFTFADCLVLACLFSSGFSFGYYMKYAYVYGNLWTHWYAVTGIVVLSVLSAFWTLRKYKKLQYRFEHFYVMFYGLMCYVMSACLMLTNNLDLSFYFGFIGLVTNYLPCFSFISLRSSSNGYRPARIAFGQFFYLGGITCGFHIFNEFEPKLCAWILLGISLGMIIGIMTNELMQHFEIHDYKKSCDLAFNLLNEEKVVFLSRKSVYVMFLDRSEYVIGKNRQWWSIAVAALLLVERSLLYSSSFMQLMQSSTVAYIGFQQLYLPFLLLTLGCLLGLCLMLRYMPKIIALLFGLLKLTLIAVVLGIYNESHPENCFLFLCFYYFIIGSYCSTVLQMILECSPFLYTEMYLGIAFSLELAIAEILKYESLANASWPIVISMGIIIIVITALSVILVQFFLPTSEGLIEMRNKLIGIQKQIVNKKEQSNIWQTNYFLHHDLKKHEFSNIKFDGDRVFQQYPATTNFDTKIRNNN